MSGAELISAERERQVTGEGWTAEHDDKHERQELVWAAQCYLFPAAYSIGSKQGKTPKDWPWDKSWFKPSPPEDHIRNLVKAGALIAAEIDRLQRQRGGDHG